MDAKVAFGTLANASQMSNLTKRVSGNKETMPQFSGGWSPAVAVKSSLLPSISRKEDDDYGLDYLA